MKEDRLLEIKILNDSKMNGKRKGYLETSSLDQTMTKIPDSIISTTPTREEEQEEKEEEEPTTGFLGRKVLFQLTTDAWILIVTKTIRLFSYGFLAVMLVIYLESLKFTSDQVGLLLTLILLGDAVISILLTTHADRWGRKFTLAAGCILAAITSFVFATQRNFYILLFAGIFGVISPSGNEIGPFMAIEISAIAEVTSDHQRTAVMAWYNLFGSFASALGGLTCGGILYYLQTIRQKTATEACSLVLILYGLIQIAQLILFIFLSPAVEPAHMLSPSNKETTTQQSFSFRWLGLHKSKWIVLRLSLLFMIDSFGSSFIYLSILSGWFYDTYGTPSQTLGTIVFYCHLIAGISALFAIQIADRIGLVLTMVVTHLPSNFFLILVPVMPTEFTSIFNDLRLVIPSLKWMSQQGMPTYKELLFLMSDQQRTV